MEARICNAKLFSEERGCRNFFFQIWITVSVTVVTLNLSSFRPTRLASQRAKRVIETFGFLKFLA